MLVKRLTKELNRINKKIERARNKVYKYDKKLTDLIDKRHKLKCLIDIEEMKERNNHESSKWQ